MESDIVGSSMGTVVPGGSTVRIRCSGMDSVGEGSVIAILVGGVLSVHRVVHIGKSARAKGWIVTHGDTNLTCDAPLPFSNVVGLVQSVRVATAWDPVVPGPRRYAWMTRAVQRIVCGLLEVHPALALRVKALVVLAMQPLVWLRPYPAASRRAASLAHTHRP